MIKWRLVLDEKAPIVAFDKEQMRRVFVNLIGNAVEAIEEELLKSSIIMIQARMMK